VINVSVLPTNLQQAIERAIQGTRQQMALNLQAAVLIPENEAKRLVSRPGTGNLYPRGARGSHRASSPGQPWASDTGRGRASITHDQVQWHGPDQVSIAWGTNVDYLKELEYGVRRGRAYVAPRPTFRRITASTALAVRARIARGIGS
jgi:hypothetical protein